MDRSIRLFFILVIFAAMSAWLLSARNAVSTVRSAEQIIWSPADEDQPTQTLEIASGAAFGTASVEQEQVAPACSRAAVREASHRAEEEAKSFDADEFCGCMQRLSRAGLQRPRSRCYSVWAYRR